MSPNVDGGGFSGVQLRRGILSRILRKRVRFDYGRRHHRRRTLFFLSSPLSRNVSCKRVVRTGVTTMRRESTPCKVAVQWPPPNGNAQIYFSTNIIFQTRFNFIGSTFHSFSLFFFPDASEINATNYIIPKFKLDFKY